MQLSGGRTKVAGGDEVPASNVSVRKNDNTSVFVCLFVFLFNPYLERLHGGKKKPMQRRRKKNSNFLKINRSCLL